MAQYILKEIEAFQWFKNGDHPNDECIKDEKGEPQSEGNVVRYFRHPEIADENICRFCKKRMFDHGWIDNKNQHESVTRVCPGDYIRFHPRLKTYFRVDKLEFEDTYKLA